MVCLDTLSSIHVLITYGNRHELHAPKTITEKQQYSDGETGTPAASAMKITCGWNFLCSCLWSVCRSLDLGTRGTKVQNTIDQGSDDRSRVNCTLISSATLVRALEAMTRYMIGLALRLMKIILGRSRFWSSNVRTHMKDQRAREFNFIRLCTRLIRLRISVWLCQVSASEVTSLTFLEPGSSHQSNR